MKKPLELWLEVRGIYIRETIQQQHTSYNHWSSLSAHAVACYSQYNSKLPPTWEVHASIHDDTSSPMMNGVGAYRRTISCYGQAYGPMHSLTMTSEKMRNARAGTTLHQNFMHHICMTHLANAVCFAATLSSHICSRTQPCRTYHQAGHRLLLSGRNDRVRYNFAMPLQ